MRPRFSSVQPPPYRHLGSGGQQPVRLQLIIALVAGLVLVAVPLYLWRRPGASEPLGSDDAGVADAGAALVVDGAVPYVPLVDASAATPGVKLSEFKRLSCQDPGPGKTPPERCDHITFFEDALARAIRENSLCAPSSKQEFSVSFVLDLDFTKKRKKVYRGKSSTLSEEKTKELFRCVTRAMPTPDWGTIPHQHARYVVSVTATYPPTDLF
ncbi:MAG: hypothetical protein IT373_03160 [Polyangiaceae bacterium]|nr:hypothetical protein [Polyangiaceae bacterium]